MTFRCSKTLIQITVLFFVAALPPSSVKAEIKGNQEGVAIIVGNKAYQDQDIPNVDYAHRDAEAIYKFVRDSLGFREENIIVLKDASQAQMVSAFGKKGNHRGKAFQYIHPNKSDLFVFFSGHGVPGLTAGGSYLLPIDADGETAEINGYPVDVLYENLGKTEARSVTVFLDACFTGNSHKGPLIKAASGIQVMPQPQKSKTPITVITAASEDQLASWDEEAEHGLFTEYLLRALYGEADKNGWGNGDGKVSLAEVEAYLDDEMRYKARRVYNREQRPTVIGDMDQVLVASIDGTFPKRPRLEVQAIAPSLDTINLDPIETELTALKNANVRAQPTAGSAKIDMLPQGESIHVAGKVKGLSWYAVELDGDKVGYIYAPLLGTPSAETIVASSQDNMNNRENIIKTSRERVSNILNQMGRVLGSQKYNKQVPVRVACKNWSASGCESQAASYMHYTRIMPSPQSCTLGFSVSILHDGYVSWKNKRVGTYMDNQPFSLDLTVEHPSRGQLMEIKNHKQQVLGKKRVFKYGPAIFTKREARDRFVELAAKVRKLCNEPGVLVASSWSEPQGESYRPPSPPPSRDYRRPPPPPRFGRPPPRRR